MEMDKNTRQIIQWAKKSVKHADKQEMGVDDMFLGVLAEVAAGRLPRNLLGVPDGGAELEWPAQLAQVHGRIQALEDLEESVKYPLSSDLRTLVHQVHVETQGKLDAPVLVRRLLESRHPVVLDFLARNRPGAQQDEGVVAKIDALSRKTAALKEKLSERVLGQRAAVDMLASAFFRASVFALPGMPRGIFTLMGPPGVGKTLLAETFADVLGEIEGEAYSLLKLDMSCYSAHQSHEQLFGFAKAYKDSGPGRLTYPVVQNPRTVILFDEIEKAHYNTLTSLLSILDRGTASKSARKGNTLKFLLPWRLSCAARMCRRFCRPAWKSSGRPN